MLTGTPAVIDGSFGVARITARAESGIDHSFFSWCVVGPLAKKGGDGTHGDPLEFKGGGFKGDIRPLLRPGSMNRAEMNEATPTWVKVRVPANSTWEVRVDGQPDFDLVHRGQFHDTGGGDIVRIVNPTKRTITEKVGIYRYAAVADADPNDEGQSGPVTLSFAPAQPAGLALAAEWDALAGAGAQAENVAGSFDAEITAFTAPPRDRAASRTPPWSGPSTPSHQAGGCRSRRGISAGASTSRSRATAPCAARRSHSYR